MREVKEKSARRMDKKKNRNSLKGRKIEEGRKKKRGHWTTT
jgi:hypothetical protein